MIILIYAQTKEGVIGNDDRLPWNIPAEMKHFQATTLNHTVLMGSKTFVSMKNRPLKNRFNIVITRNPKKFNEIKADNLMFTSDVEAIVKKYQHTKTNNLYVIGGNEIFELFFDYADEIIRTTVYENYPGNIKISNYDFEKFEKTNIIKEDEFEIEYFKRKE
ncbi:dihydrofolate reductase [Williamsoniiplasma lucivorax]|uniref:dihydrofolate reductase n=1 Tax=Williamsoniiplasma lucivorax TaxID=209274 RepID=A0A2S5REB8_9MOLU|nr:dihydrofolate reductase [Williamsoniiplasma lucivorax]PPE05475.1 dihydrofolate reductase [Williamsoniiplasma lucivorax]